MSKPIPLRTPGIKKKPPPETGFPIREQLKRILYAMDQALEDLPEDKIAEFAGSKHFDVYEKLFYEIGLDDAPPA